MRGAERIHEEKWWKLLKEAASRQTGGAGDFETAIPALKFHSHIQTEKPIPHFLKPLIIVILQGSKYVRIGAEEIRYAERESLLCTVDMPVSSCVLEASPECPYLSLSLELDMELIATFSSRIAMQEKTRWNPARGAIAYRIPAEFLDALLRLVEIADDKERSDCLGEGILKELHYSLLKHQGGALLQGMGSANFATAQVRQLISWIKANYRSSFSIREIARDFALAPSTLFKYFKEITSVSPIQYQKLLRLCEAKRLLETGGFRISEIAEKVGYVSPTQFSREYKRLFGSSPKKHK